MRSTNNCSFLFRVSLCVYFFIVLIFELAQIGTDLPTKIYTYRSIKFDPANYVCTKIYTYRSIIKFDPTIMYVRKTKNYLCTKKHTYRTMTKFATTIIKIHVHFNISMFVPYLRTFVLWTYDFVQWVDPLSYFSLQPVLHDWCNKGRGMCYPVCGMVHIKEPLLLIGKSSLCGGSGFPFSLSEWP